MSIQLINLKDVVVDKGLSLNSIETEEKEPLKEDSNNEVRLNNIISKTPEDICVICQEDLRDPKKIEVNLENCPPMHISHKGCLKSWVEHCVNRKHEKASCPLGCDKELTETDLKNLDLKDLWKHLEIDRIKNRDQNTKEFLMQEYNQFILELKRQKLEHEEGSEQNNVDNSSGCGEILPKLMNLLIAGGCISVVAGIVFLIVPPTEINNNEDALGAIIISAGLVMCVLACLYHCFF